MADVTLTGSGNWSVPTGVGAPRVITVECFGGGGAGGAGISASGGGGGGGGGAYSKKTGIAVTPGQSIPYVCGAGGIKNNTGTGGAGQDTTFNTNVCVGDGGLGGLAYSAMTGGAGGTEANSVGDASSQAKGGNGGTGNITYGGGGGESGNFASPNYVDGNNGTDGASGGAGGTGTTGYDGGAGAAAHGQGSNAPSYSGGGGGAGHMSGGEEYGGTGGPGIILITYTTLDAAPTTTIDTPDNNATGQSITPDLLFTGTDTNADEVEYEVQVDTAVGFNSIVGSFSVNKINVRMGYGGSPTDGVYVRVYSDTGSTLLGTSNTVPYTSITSGGSDNDFTFTTPPQLSGTTKYYFSVYRTGARNETNYFRVFQSTSDVYADGGPYSMSNGSWGSEGTAYDHAFIVYDAASGAIVTQSSYGANAVSFYGVGVFEGVGQSFTTPAVANTPLLDKLSSTESPSHFAGTGSPSPFPSGNQITYSVQAAAGLVNNTPYYWRVKAKDALGSNTFGAWSPGDASDGYNKFTTVAAGPTVYVPRSGFIHLGNTAIA